jgi:hypothetical protein
MKMSWLRKRRNFEAPNLMTAPLFSIRSHSYSLYEFRYLNKIKTFVCCEQIKKFLLKINYKGYYLTRSLCKYILVIYSNTPKKYIGWKVVGNKN